MVIQVILRHHIEVQKPLIIQKIIRGFCFVGFVVSKRCRKRFTHQWLAGT
jgi:hypothetical protein